MFGNSWFFRWIRFIVISEFEDYFAFSKRDSVVSNSYYDELINFSLSLRFFVERNKYILDK